jgi:hypothetical protein
MIFSGVLTSTASTFFPSHIDGEESNDTPLHNLIEQVDTTMIENYLDTLVSYGPRFTGTPACQKVATFLYDEFTALGLDTSFHHWNTVKYHSKNIEAIHQGTDTNSTPTIILIAHYDTIGDSPGANDDGSGIVTLLTIAQILKTYSFAPTIRYVAVSGEEIGTYGSHFYARDCNNQDDNIIAVLNVDTVGYTTKTGENSAYLLHNSRSQWISTMIVEICDNYQNEIGLKIKPIGNRGNDHHSFLEYGYDAVQFVQLERGDYPLHTPEDTIDKINYTYLSKIIKLVLSSTYKLATYQQPVQVSITSPKEGFLYIDDTALFCLPGYNIGGIGLRGMTYLFGETTASIKITSDEKISSVAFCLDGFSSFTGYFQQPPYEWIIESVRFSLFPLIGKHTLGVYVTTDEGSMAYDEMDLFFLTPI